MVEVHGVDQVLGVALGKVCFALALLLDVAADDRDVCHAIRHLDKRVDAFGIEVRCQTTLAKSAILIQGGPLQASTSARAHTHAHMHARECA